MPAATDWLDIGVLAVLGVSIVLAPVVLIVFAVECALFLRGGPRRGGHLVAPASETAITTDDRDWLADSGVDWNDLPSPLNERDPDHESGPRDRRSEAA